MFRNINCGWVTVDLGSFSDRASYLTDIPVDMLESLIHSYEKGVPAVIKFDAEGWEYIMVIDDFCTYIIDESCRNDNECLNGDGKKLLTTVEISKNVIVGEILMDIIHDLDDWVMWRGNLSLAGKVDRRKEIFRLIEELNELRIDYEMSRLDE